MADNNQKLDLPKNASIMTKKDTIPRIAAQLSRENMRIRRPSKKSKGLIK